MKILWLVILGLSLAQKVSARSPEAEAQNFREQGILLLKQSQARGVTQIADTPIETLIEDLRRLPLQINPHNIYTMVGNRRSAMWMTDGPQGRVSLNPVPEGTSPESLGVLAIHETLGYFYKKDLKYEHSMLEVWGANKGLVGKETEQQDLIQSLKDRAKSGGSTVVGGGGDLDDLRFRMEGLKTLAQLESSGGVFFTPRHLGRIRKSLLTMDVSPADHLQMPFEIWDLPDKPTIVYVGSSLYRTANEHMGLLAVQAAEGYAVFVPEGPASDEIKTLGGSFDLVTAFFSEFRALHQQLPNADWDSALHLVSTLRMMPTHDLDDVFEQTIFKNGLVIDVDMDLWAKLSKEGRKQAMRRWIREKILIPPTPGVWGQLKVTMFSILNPDTRAIVAALQTAVESRARTETFNERVSRLTCAFSDVWNLYGRVDPPMATPFRVDNVNFPCLTEVKVDNGRLQNSTPDEREIEIWDVLGRR